MSTSSEPKFFIRGGDIGFANRQKDIFDLLNVAEKEKNDRQLNEVLDSEDGNVLSPENEVMDVSVASARSHKKLRSVTRQFRGKESIFKRPEAPPPRAVRSIPDYQRHPHRWTKYSLGDVSQEDMSEKSNTAAALSFLRELEARRSVEPIEDMELDKSHIKFTPKRKAVPEEGTSTELAMSSFRSTKLIMPEYVVGQEKKKAKKSIKRLSSENEKSNASIKLAHLEEEEDE